ncbi:DUF4350 domain-containing protein [Streptomyces tirandamycinicus]|uniref:DUF4350 domain-containing protein n=1 Tax=Streptomyces tirandamycinicus TaxID=2174846 RepID=A0A2S1SRX5_9ACTN|nr:DUF4350 domain-containing protein [Streptomyces tirandamycinicus]AWI29100.1 DUF4350 domain-containing protein [Streptomyces tirandamycinicus]
MTGTASGTTAVSPTSHQVWTRSRGILLVLVILVVAGFVIAVIRSGGGHGRLDPRSTDPSGSRAVAELLKDRGVTTRVVTTLDEAVTATGPDSTLLVAGPDLLTSRQQAVLRAAMASSGGRTVLVAPGRSSVGALVPGASADTPAPVSAREPQCAFPAARRAGSADLGGWRYTIDSALGSDSCYLVDGLPTLLRIDDAGTGDTVLLGAPDILYNERLDDQGNASLALQLLGSRPHLVWYLPSLSDGSADGEARGEGETGIGRLIPSGWLWGTLQLAVAAVLAAVWRARRLGPLVSERLPVAVRASESSEGRARLYRRANARDHAASVLRQAARSRLAPLLGVTLADAHSPEALLPAVSAHLRDGDRDLRTLLFGPAPADDAALIRLADQLDALEREVRTS